MDIFERLLYTCTSYGFFIRLSLDLAFCMPRWPVMEYRYGGPVGLSKPSSHKFHLKHLINPNK